MNKELFSHIIITALEGGINYWGCLANDHEYFETHYNNKNRNSLSEFVVDLLESGKSVFLFDKEEMDRELLFNEMWELNKSKIVKGYEMFVKDHGKIEIENIDSQLADNIIQYALFNELVYG